MQKTDRITILGITGYTGTWLAQQLTQAGYTNVVGTYRNQVKFNQLQAVLPSVKGIQADLLTSPEKVTTALTGSRWVFNNSAPFTGEEQTIEDFIKTKVTIINHLIQSIQRVKTVQKLVHIGSAAAIYMGIGDNTKNVIDEDTWPDLAHMDTHYEPFIDMKVAEEKGCGT
ncbi:NAD-dependent epimerase/dehydratase family protein [Lactiplantibacillus carotarum]|uniref:NAD-dependent epimerase/dehydratase family protein n=1 Tax=Lactiplantibacillus carotarum TaxID=2993456 RepID=UPI00298F0B0F|nr:NAD-dependent epimerase/dehydratase family protein [Lactiplantibacillus carotarum]